MSIKAGGDPCALPEYRTLGIEMARLAHPACPQVDWQSVEQSCLALFARNGADLQTAAAYALARSHLAGLNGICEGVALLQALLQADGRLWPPGVSARAHILSQLFSQWQGVLRETEVNAQDLANLRRLNVQLGPLGLTLLDHTSVAVGCLDALRQQIDHRALRLERDAKAATLTTPDAKRTPPSHSPPQACPARTQPVIVHRRSRFNGPQALWIGGLVAVLLSLIAVLAWT